MRYFKNYIFGLILSATFHCTLAQNYKVLSSVKLEADGPEGIETYNLIRSVLGPDPIEAPDLYPDNHAGVQHIIEETDAILGNHFTFLIHRDIDKDRDTDNTDRQRNEIKAYADSDAKLKSFKDESLRYHWYFMLDSGFTISKNFSHFFQLKAVGGDYSSQPILTISGSINSNKYQFEIMHSRLTGNEDVQLASADWLKANTGKWMEIEVLATFSDNGYVKVSISDFEGDTILSVEKEGIDMWREGSEFVRPKWGIYRSLSTKNYLSENEERVRFANFSVEKVLLNYVPVLPQQALNPSPMNGANFMDSAINLSWLPGNDAEGHRIYLSTDSTQLDANFIDSTSQNSYFIAGLKGLTTYFWRIDEWNALGTTKGEIWNFTTAAKTVELYIQENELGFVGVDGSIEDIFPGFTGKGYANSNDESGAKISWLISTAERDYFLKWRYANGTNNNASAFIKVNNKAMGIVSFKPTGSWETWGLDSVKISAESGKSNIELQAITAIGLANIDYLYTKGGDLEVLSTGIAEVENHQVTVSVFPNPFSDQLTLYFTDKSIQNCQWYLYDIFGRLIMHSNQYKALPSIEIINTQHLPKGSYLLRIALENNNYNIKLIK